ncbi:MAG: MBL fold metallo-hydrolase [Parcubacteria group bacterium]|nr:MBL fold metallo-hydrolase [Parcubacteria group bacterium]
MNITKLGHCCLVIEDKGVRIMTDPGAWSTLQNEEKSIDYIFITHEHQDHFHLESLKKVLANNPKAKVVTNKSVGKLLNAEYIPYQLLEHGDAKEFEGVRVEGHGEKHAVIYKEFGQVQNTGYFFANRFFYPGDAFFDPKKPVEILALPVAGPWMKISDAIDYAKLLKPKVAFPVHDGMLKILGPFHNMPQKILSESGTRFEPMTAGDSRDF